MLQQLERGRLTEIDALNGYVARESRKLGSLAAGQVHKMVKFVNSLSRLWGEGGQRLGEGSAANRDAALGGLRSLATTCCSIQ